MKRNSYLIRWSTSFPFNPIEVTTVHNNTVGGMRLSSSGDQIGIITADGWIKVIDEANH